MNIAYVLGTFPAFTETFVLNEILELEKDPRFRITIYAEKGEFQPLQPQFHSLKSEVVYQPSFVVKYNLIPNLTLFISKFIINPKKALKIISLVRKYYSKRRIELILATLWISGELKRGKIDHLHTHFHDHSSDIAFLVKLYAGIPFSFTIHNEIIGYPKNRLRLKMREAKFIVTIGSYNRRLLEKIARAKEKTKIHLIHSGINTQIFKPGKQQFHNPKTLTILSVGRLVEHKGFDVLIKAARLIRAKGLRNFVINIIGDGQEKQQLSNLTTKLSMAKTINFLGNLAQTEVFRRYLSDADLFVLPCINLGPKGNDGLPVSLLEAMACGIPVISTYIFNIPEAIGPKEGLLVREKDPQALAEGMIKIMLMKKEERKEIGLMARKKIIQEYNLVVEVSKLRSLFLS